MMNAKDIQVGDEIVVTGRSYFIEDIEPNGWFFAVGNNGEEVDGNLDSIDAHFSVGKFYEKE